jgi:hypothetical protein
MPAKHKNRVEAFVISLYNPIDNANSLEVSFNNKSPPKDMPKV